MDRDAELQALVAQLEGDGFLSDPQLEEAMLAIPRHQFVPSLLQAHAYADHPLPVGYDQTLSAPHMVAWMTSLLQLKAGDNVLEIGTGMGYQAAVLEAMVRPGHVTSVEWLAPLAALALDNLARTKSPVNVVHGDGADGWPESGPYDAILITCAVPSIPPRLVDQLNDGGHLVAPVGMEISELRVARKTGSALVWDDHGPCRFVQAQGRLGLPNPSD